MFNLNHRQDRGGTVNTLCVYRLIVNPQIKGYPPIFMLCRDRQGVLPREYAIGTTFLNLNKLLMKAVPNHKRLPIAEKLAEAVMPKAKTSEIDIPKICGSELEIENFPLALYQRRFFSDSVRGEEPLYFFEMVDL